MAFKKRLIDLTTLLGLRLLLIIAVIFPYKMFIMAGARLGRIGFRLLKKQRDKTLAHLRLAFGDEKDEKEIRETALSCFQNLGMGLFELLSIRWRGLNNIQNFITIEGEGHLKEALSQGKGLILITAHLGNWELCGMLLARMGYQLSAIAAPMHNERLGDIAKAYRSRFNIDTITRGERSSARKIIRLLRGNRILALLLDQDIEGDGVYVDFFGKKAYTPSGVTSLAIRLNIPVLMIFIVREDGYRHKIIIDRPDGLRKSGDIRSDILFNTALLTKIIESYIRAYAGQWVWMHNRWQRIRRDR